MWSFKRNLFCTISVFTYLYLVLYSVHTRYLSKYHHLFSDSCLLVCPARRSRGTVLQLNTCEICRISNQMNRTRKLPLFQCGFFKSWNLVDIFPQISRFCMGLISSSGVSRLGYLLALEYLVLYKRSRRSLGLLQQAPHQLGWTWTQKWRQAH